MLHRRPSNEIPKLIPSSLSEITLDARLASPDTPSPRIDRSAHNNHPNLAKLRKPARLRLALPFG